MDINGDINRKSIVELSWNVDELTYRKDSAISYSILSRYSREGFRKLGSLFDKVESPALRFGSAVDTMLTDGIDAFKERFTVCEFPSLSEALIGIARDLFESYGSQYRSIDLIPDDDIIAHTISYQPTWGAEAKLRTIKSKCNDYYKLLAISADKEILSQKDYNDTVACVNELKNNPYTKYFFYVNPFDNRFEKVFQLKFKAKYNGISVRCMFDELIVDHEEKVIYPIDLKTSGHAEEDFEQSFVTWRYMIQAQLYTYILQQVISEDEYFKDFKIAHYSFIVINRYTLAPLVWRYYGNFSEVDLKDNEGNIYRNWRKLLEELDYYLNEPSSKYTKEAKERNGIMKIDNLQPV